VRCEGDECCKRLRLALEAGKPIRIISEGSGKNLECDVAIEPRIAGAIHLAHAACSEQTHNLIGTDACSRRETHLRTFTGVEGRHPAKQ
jgi:hypothetical protein